MAVTTRKDDERCLKMMAMRCAGQSAAAIAREIGGLSRNAVIAQTDRVKKADQAFDENDFDAERYW
ncbi:MAG: hypothetical protein EP336_09400 [Rhodobacteraceae bacterium]|nr:MAG: hypothetical protein EP336_09400 [Paracoccaceae bacterium]